MTLAGIYQKETFLNKESVEQNLSILPTIIQKAQSLFNRPFLVVILSNLQMTLTGWSTRGYLFSLLCFLHNNGFCFLIVLLSMILSLLTTKLSENAASWLNLKVIFLCNI